LFIFLLYVYYSERLGVIFIIFSVKDFKNHMEVKYINIWKIQKFSKSFFNIYKFFLIFNIWLKLLSHIHNFQWIHYLNWNLNFRFFSSFLVFIICFSFIFFVILLFFWFYFDTAGSGVCWFCDNWIYIITWFSCDRSGSTRFIGFVIWIWLIIDIYRLRNFSIKQSLFSSTFFGLKF